MVNTCEGSIQVGPSANETSEKEEAGRDLPIEEVKVMQHEDVVKTAELQHVMVMKTTVDEVMQLEDVVKTAEIQM